MATYSQIPEDAPGPLQLMRNLKAILWIAGTTLCLLSRAVGADISPLFSIGPMKGDFVVYADKENTILPTPKSSADKTADSVFIQYKKEGADTKNIKYFITHNSGTAECVLVAGNRTMTFVELKGEASFLWVVCMDQRHPDGSFLVIKTGIKNYGGPLGVVGTTMTGRATLTGELQ